MDELIHHILNRYYKSNHPTKGIILHTSNRNYYITNPIRLRKESFITLQTGTAILQIQSDYERNHSLHFKQELLYYKSNQLVYKR